MRQLAGVEPKIIAAAFDTLEEMLTRLGLMVNGVVTAESAGRVVVADEKGFLTRSVRGLGGPKRQPPLLATGGGSHPDAFGRVVCPL